MNLTSFPHDFQVFAEIREKNVRVIICDMFEPAARAVMCEAYRQVWQ